jgi:hypothetical protein
VRSAACDASLSNCRLDGIIARLTAVPPYQHGVEQACYYAAQHHYAYAESQRKVSLAPNARFGGWHAARESYVHEWVAGAYHQPNGESGQERETAAEHENVLSNYLAGLPGKIGIHAFFPATSIDAFDH